MSIPDTNDTSTEYDTDDLHGEEDEGDEGDKDEFLSPSLGASLCSASIRVIPATSDNTVSVVSPELGHSWHSVLYAMYCTTLTVHNFTKTNI